MKKKTTTLGSYVKVKRRKLHPKHDHPLAAGLIEKKVKFSSMDCQQAMERAKADPEAQAVGAHTFVGLVKRMVHQYAKGERNL